MLTKTAIFTLTLLVSSLAYSGGLPEFNETLPWPELEKTPQCWDILSRQNTLESLAPLSLHSAAGNGQGKTLAHLAMVPSGKTVLLYTQNNTAMRASEDSSQRTRAGRPIQGDGPPAKDDVWDYTWKSGSEAFVMHAHVAQYHVWQKRGAHNLSELTPAQALQSDGPFVDELLLTGTLSTCKDGKCVKQQIVLSTGCAT